MRLSIVCVGGRDATESLGTWPPPVGDDRRTATQYYYTIIHKSIYSLCNTVWLV